MGYRMDMTRNRYNAYKDHTSQLWVGWMVYANSPRNVIETPDRYPSKREALAAIRAQHP